MANEKLLEILKKGPTSWNSWRQTYPGIRPNLAGADLHGLVLSGADLSHANLRHAILIGTDLTNADLSDADLSEADLRMATFSTKPEWKPSAQNEPSSLTLLKRANLSEADLSSLNLSRAQFKGADLSSAYLRGANLGNIDLTGADLTDANLQEARLPLRWIMPVLALPYTPRLRISNYSVDFTGAILHRAKMENTDFTLSSFDGAKLTSADLSETNLIGAIFSSSTKWPTEYEATIETQTVSAPPSHDTDVFHIRFDRRLSPRQVADALQALADYYRACGGVGFKIDSEPEKEQAEDQPYVF